MTIGAVTKQVNGKVEKKAPKAVPFVLCNVFLDRFSSSGVLAILALFFYQKLGFDRNVSTAVYHTYEFLIYFTTIFGAIIAESWLGLFKTIASMNLMYALGATIVSLGAIEVLGLPILAMSMVGLLATIAGAGCLKSNLNAFAGNQFQLPEQAAELTTYFSMQYFSLKCGSMLARVVVPIMREDVKCFGMVDCYPLAFALPGLAMLIAGLVFISGRKGYVEESFKENMFVKVTKCIITGIAEKFKSHKNDPKAHWIDYAEEKHGIKLVMETKTVLNVMVMYAPLPFFWALHSQQGSRWVFQATKLNGDIGFYVIKPDQMILLNSFLAILLIPVFERLIYPLLEKVGIQSSLQRMGLGGALSGLAFVFAAAVEYFIEQDFISILWMLPQYFIMVTGEILLYTASINFAYTEATTSMKSVVMSFMSLSVAGGCLIIIIISGVALFESQLHEFIFFAVVAFIDVILFAFLATRYRNVNQMDSREDAS